MSKIIYFIIYYTMTVQVHCPIEYDVFERPIVSATLEYKRCYKTIDTFKRVSQEELNEAIEIDRKDNSILITRIDTITLNDNLEGGYIPLIYNRQFYFTDFPFDPWREVIMRGTNTMIEGPFQTGIQRHYMKHPYADSMQYQLHDGTWEWMSTNPIDTTKNNQ